MPYSDFEERLRRLEESHEALARRVAGLDSVEGAIRMERMANRAKLPRLLWGTLATIVVLGLAVFFLLP
jgi:hypothetical protein